jgi:hypothetical protein
LLFAGTCPLDVAWDTLATLTQTAYGPFYECEDGCGTSVSSKLSLGSKTDSGNTFDYTGSADATYEVKIARVMTTEALGVFQAQDTDDLLVCKTGSENCFAKIEDGDTIVSTDTDTTSVSFAVAAKITDNKVKVLEVTSTHETKNDYTVVSYGRNPQTWSYKKSTDTDWVCQGAIVAATDVDMVDGLTINFASATYTTNDKWWIHARAHSGDDFDDVNVNTGHQQVECSGRGLCDRKTGQCSCFAGYGGEGCQRSK